MLFDLLTALLDSWSLWNAVAGNEALGIRWRKTYLQLTYATGPYRAYEACVEEAALQVGMTRDAAVQLVARWDELQPWPEAPSVLQTVGKMIPMAIVTNCSEALAQRATARLGVHFDVMVSAERARYYKPQPQPYTLALSELGVPPERALFVAGSPFDIAGASAVGMSVFWHNRLELPLPQAGLPVGIERSLWPLAKLLHGGLTDEAQPT
ncbi:MAG: HAD-IA family hydrolase [Chloroflexi bacterium]|nr:HAD-IA family hydrolase [Chloroflexota bacterium]